MDDELDFKKDVLAYCKGYFLAIILTVIPFAVVAKSSLAANTIWLIVASCGLVQLIVHFRYFLHIDLTRQKREDLHLILFSFLLLSIMVLGTIWIMHSLSMRMH